MSGFENYSKYKPYQYGVLDLKDRQWPSKTIKKAPIWCSVDLRDGNQALPVPMNIEKKVMLYNLIKSMGFKEIEVAFPSASDTEFSFVRKLIDEKLVDDDTVIQVLTQTRDHLIDRTFEVLQGAKKAVVHIYNSTSVQQRKVVFNMSKKEIIDIALKGAKRVKALAKNTDTEIFYEYSPESFTGTEMEYALEIVEEVLNVWQPTPNKKVIINIPATVEMATPNVFADQVEWLNRKISARDSVILSVHTHNDRGTSVAASELAILAGADRVEGTLFGNGERTGNVDLITLAMNLYSQGINPELNIENIGSIVKVYEETIGMKVHERHPYAGNLVYTAFSGSHQDAIRKGLKIHESEKSEHWEVPYLPIDPADLGRTYKAIIRINSQSGKGGVAFILEHDFGYHLPKPMHVEFGRIIKEKSDSVGGELSPAQIFGTFKETYLSENGLITLKKYSIKSKDNVIVNISFLVNGEEKKVKGRGNGPIEAFFEALKEIGVNKYSFESYEEHSLSSGADAEAVAYIALKEGEKIFFGISVDKNTTTASFKAILSAINRYNKGQDK